jgi:pimeloyl-ACP methyl ester carboxylesterase
MNQLLHSKILGTGTPLLILHGFLGSGDNWISLGRKFSKDFEVHLIDLRNHGRSFHDDEMDFEVMYEDVVRYCQTKDLANVSIIGHSMGGKVGMHLAVQQAGLVQKLIVVDIAPKAYRIRHDFILMALKAVDFSQHKTRDEVATVLAKFIKQKPIIQFLLKNVYRASNDRLGFRFNLAIFLEKYGNIIESLPVYSQYEGEVLFLKGEHSDYILEEDTALITAHFPKVSITTIANSGHWLHAENPIDFYNSCILHLKKH